MAREPIGRVTVLYVRCLERTRLLVLLFWTTMLILGSIFGLGFMQNTTTTFTPPSSSESAIANERLRVYFPTLAAHSDMALFIESQEDVRYRQALNQTVLAVREWAWAYKGKQFITNFQSYHTFKYDGLPDIATDAFFPEKRGEDKYKITLVSLSIRASYDSKEAEEFANKLRDQVIALTPKDGKDIISLTGISAFLQPILDSAEKDMAKVDAFVMPLAMGVLALVLKSVRMMIMPILCVAVSALTSFLLMYWISMVLDVDAVVPSIMMSLLIAMSIDYSLFLLSRYREAVLYGCGARAAVEQTVASAGHTIIVSGSTLAICFTGLCFFPLELLQSLGVGSALAILVTLAVNITIIPCMLISFGPFFIRGIRSPSVCAKCAPGMAPVRPGEWPAAHDESDELLPSEYIEESTFEEDTAKEFEAMKLSCWYKVGTKILRVPINLILIGLIILFVYPFARQATSTTTTDSMVLNMPRGEPSTASYQRMIDDFGPGELYSYKLLVVPPKAIAAGGIVSEVVSNQISDAVEFFLTNPVVAERTSKLDFAGFSYQLGGAIEWKYLNNCVQDPDFDPEICPAFTFAINQFCNLEKNATWMLIVPKFDPIGPEGDEWLREMRAVIKQYMGNDKSMGFEYRLTGMAAESSDAISAVYAMFPYMITITTVVVLAITGVAFRSLLIPIRAVFTIGLTIFWVYGFAKMVYVDGALDKLGIPGLAKMGALVWMIPVMNFSIIVGIGLDYDIFLLVRVHEYWKQGLPVRDAILLGLYKTGHIITAAGFIMAIAFSGLLASTMPAINQLAFYLVFSVLFDTFIVRTVLVTCIMDVLGEWSFFPLKRKAFVAPLTRGGGGSARSRTIQDSWVKQGNF